MAERRFRLPWEVPATVWWFWDAGMELISQWNSWVFLLRQPGKHNPSRQPIQRDVASRMYSYNPPSWNMHSSYLQAYFVVMYPCIYSLCCSTSCQIFELGRRKGKTISQLRWIARMADSTLNLAVRTAITVTVHLERQLRCYNNLMVVWFQEKTTPQLGNLNIMTIWIKSKDQLRLIKEL